MKVCAEAALRVVNWVHLSAFAKDDLKADSMALKMGYVLAEWMVDMKEQMLGELLVCTLDFGLVDKWGSDTVDSLVGHLVHARVDVTET